MVSKRSGKPICAPPRLSEVFANVAFETVPIFGTIRLIRDGENGGKGVWRWRGEREIIYL